jgi:hypothetical protein
LKFALFTFVITNYNKALIMRKISFYGILLAVLFCTILTPLTSFSGTYTFSPSVADLNDLEHAKWYKWGIKWTLPAHEEITAAKITYYNIWDWQVEPDHLYTHLLNTVNDTNGNTTPNWVPKVGYETITKIGNDSDGDGDYFAGKGILLGNWNDPHGGSNGAHAINLSYDITSANFSWLSDGNFGFGIDPNCHYYNTRIVVEINTSPVPEPSTMLLLGLGLMSITGIRRKLKK